MNPGRMGILALVMLGFAIAVYLGLASLRHRTAAAVPAPMAAQVSRPLAGTLYLTQGGGLYRLQGTRFTQLLAPGGGWMQPALAPDRQSLAIVKRSAAWSDVWLTDLDGHPLRQLTRSEGGDVTSDHWAFYPRFGTDGVTIYYSLDDPKAGFRVDLAIWAMNATGGPPRRWTAPNPYTGGDVAPLAVDGRTIIYSRFGFDAESRIHSVLVIQTLAFGVARELTLPGDDCGQPALSPDHSRLAMICTGGQQHGRLVVADFDGRTLSSPQVLVDGQLATAPAWDPDGGGLAYLAPAGAAGKFQLWYVQSPAGVAPIHKPVQLTDGLDFDASSRIVWF